MRSRARRKGRAIEEALPSPLRTVEGKSRNVDHRVVKGFGEEWSRFGNRQLAVDELEAMFGHYTSVFPWEDLPEDAEGFDAGCGSGRWARFFAPRVGRLHCIDASV